MNATLKAKIALRQKSRFIAVQALYQWLITQTPLNELLAQSRMDNVKKPCDWPFFDELVKGVVSSASDLDESLLGLIDRPFEQISPIEKSIMRLGVYELKHCLDVPYVVVINEYVDLAKSFGATDSFKYVNSLLHGVATFTREIELAAYSSKTPKIDQEAEPVA